MACWVPPSILQVYLAAIIASMFGGNVHIAFISNLVNAVTSAIDIIEKVLFIGLGLKALNQGSISFPVVDKLINKYM